MDIDMSFDDTPTPVCDSTTCDTCGAITLMQDLYEWGDFLLCGDCFDDLSSLDEP